MQSFAHNGTINHNGATKMNELSNSPASIADQQRLPPVRVKQGAARSPYGTISETAINAALAMIEAAAPRDEIEGALAVQMACTHAAAMAVLAKIDSGFGTERRIAALGSTAARLMKTFAMQVEVLRRLRNGGQQFVRVEHVHVNDGGQALIGNVKK